MARKSVKKLRPNNNNNNSRSNRSRKSKKVVSYRKQWYCFGTMTILSNHKRTAEKYLNQLDDAGVKPEEIKIYQGKGQGAGGYSRINICYYANRKLIDSTF
jgi:hypothetical protein